MGVFFEIIGIAAIPYFVIKMLLRWQENADRKATVKWQSRKMSEYEDRLNKAGAVVLDLEKEVLRKSELIDDLVLDRTERVKREADLERCIVQLRRDLQKRTEQYNELVDLAIEKGIIDK